MRKLIIVLPALLVVGCAATGGQYSKVYDRKYNAYAYAVKQGDSEFVGTAASATKQKPVWWRYGHP